MRKERRLHHAAASLWIGYIFFDSYLSDFYFSDGSMSFQMPAAQAPPTKGPMMKIQRLVRAVPPWKMAGAILRAGFTEVPV
jgi:hypothetical protein